jgi:hypothetical protein
MPLFAQEPAPLAGFPTGWLVAISVIVLLLLFVGLVLWVSLRYAAHSRELSHLERLKALDAGQPLEPAAESAHQRYAHNAFWIAFWVGAGVPIAATWAAGTVMTRTDLPPVGLVLAVWLSVAGISIAGVVCATVLMLSTRQAPPAGGDRPPDPAPAEHGIYEARRP